MSKRGFNFDDPAWKEPEDFFIPKPAKPSEWPRLLEEIRSAGKEAKVARKTLEISLLNDLVDLTVQLSDSRKQFEALVWKQKGLVSRLIDNFQGDPKDFYSFVTAEIKKVLKRITSEEADAVIKEKEAALEAMQPIPKEIEAALRQQIDDMAIKRAQTFKSYMELLKAAERSLDRAIQSYKGDASGLAAFVRAEVE